MAILQTSYTKWPRVERHEMHSLAFSSPSPRIFACTLLSHEIHCAFCHHTPVLAGVVCMLPVAERHRRDNLNKPLGQAETQCEVAVLCVYSPLGEAACF